MYPQLVFFHNSSLTARLIQFGQRLRFGRGPSHWNHVAVRISPTQAIEALSHGVTLSEIADWDANEERLVVPINATEYDRVEMLAFLRRTISDPYGWWTVVTVILHLVTAGKVSLLRSGTYICSGLASEMLERGTAFFEDASSVTPAELYLTVTAKGRNAAA